MIVSEVDSLLDNWQINMLKGFEYKNHTVYFTEYLVIKKCEENVFEVLHNLSSIKTGPFNRETMFKLLCSNRLICIDHNAYDVNYKYKKSGQCCCGAWATSEPNCHAYWCDKYTR